MGFWKCDFCVYVEFENGFGNDTLGYIEIRWLTLSTHKKNKNPRWQRYGGNVIAYGESPRSWRYEGNVIAHGESPESWQNKSPRWQRYGGNVKAHGENPKS